MAESKVWRCMLIEPLEESVTITVLPKKNYHEEMKRMLGYDTREHVYTPGHENVFIVDEMGLLKPDANSRGFFQPSFFYQPICGKALLLGLTLYEGDLTDCQLNLEVVQKQINFPKVRFTGFTRTEGEVEHPVLGKMFQIKTVANFEPLAEGQSGSTH